MRSRASEYIETCTEMSFPCLGHRSHHKRTYRPLGDWRLPSRDHWSMLQLQAPIYEPRILHSESANIEFYLGLPISKRVSGRTNQMFGEVKDNTAGIKITVSICQARQFQNTIDGSYILNTPPFEYIHNENSSHDSLCWSQSRPDRSWWDLHTDGTHSDTQSNK